MKKEQIVSQDPHVMHGTLVLRALAYQLKA